MLRQFSLAIFLPLLFSFSVVAQNLPLDELINKHLQARGGVEKLKSIQTMKITGKTLAQGRDNPFKAEIKRPYSTRFETSFQGKSFIIAYDGETAWRINPFSGNNEPEKVPDDLVKDQRDEADIDGPLMEYKTKGNNVDLVGKEDLDGSPAYKLKVTLKNGNITYIYLDAGNFLILRQTSKRTIAGTEVESDNYYSDYKSVNGMLMAYSLEFRQKGQTVAQQVIDKIEINIPIDDTIFKMPAKSEVKEPAKQ